MLDNQATISTDSWRCVCFFTARLLCIPEWGEESPGS